jgi:tetratricopeptide (TPR) repeat protein
MEQEDPNDAFTLYAIGLEYLKIDKQKAVEYFTKLIISQPNYVSTYYQLGTLFAESGDKSEAENIFRKGIEIATKIKDFHALSELKNVLNNMILGLDDE